MFQRVGVRAVLATIALLGIVVGPAAGAAVPAVASDGGGGEYEVVEKIVDVAAGGEHVLVLTESGRVFAWGENTEGQLGDGNTSSTRTMVPVQVVGLPEDDLVIDIFAIKNTSIAVMQSGAAYAWGSNAGYRFGNGETTNSSVPVRLAPSLADKNIVQVSDRFVLTDTGEVWGWDGVNYYGTLGNGTTTGGSTTPVLIATLPADDPVISVSSSGSHVLALTESGAVYSWGLGFNGQLGIGTDEDSLVPVRVSAFDGKRVVAIEANQYYSMALTDDGELYTWGHGGDGRLGQGREVAFSSYNPLPAQVVSGFGGEGVALVSGTPVGSVGAVTESGKVWAWGNNKQSCSLGIDSCLSVVSPEQTLLPAEEVFRSIAMGVWYTIALTEAGEVWFWGSWAGVAPALVEPTWTVMKSDPEPIDLPPLGHSNVGMLAFQIAGIATSLVALAILMATRRSKHSTHST